MGVYLSYLRKIDLSAPKDSVVNSHKPEENATPADQGEQMQTMIQISGFIAEGAVTFLAREYEAVALFALVMAIVLGVFVSPQTSVAFLCGAL